MSSDPSTPLTLADAQAMLRQKAQELVTAPMEKVSGLNMELQRLRVLCVLMREAETGVLDPNSYKEMALLNRMVAGTDLESEADKQKRAEQEEAATATLEKRGVKPDSARRILRVLTSVLSKDANHDNPLDDTEPPDDEQADPAGDA